MITSNLLVSLQFSDYCNAISAFSSLVTLILAYIIYKVFAKQQVLAKQKKIIRHRDAEDGKYVTEEYAKKNPKTTVKETDKAPPKLPPKKK